MQRVKSAHKSQTGLSLIELIVAIVIVGTGLAGILAAYNNVVQRSVDPMVRKQALAIAESLLLEIEQQPFTWCDPQDATATTASSAAGCTVAQNNQNNLTGPTPASESRGSPSSPYDNVADYSGLGANPTLPASDILGGNIVVGYTVRVAITRVGGTAPFATIPLDAALRIAVTVTGHGESLTLAGYRLRYAPNWGG